MDASERFVELVNRTDAEIPLDEAALAIAAHAHPSLVPEVWTGRLDELAAHAPADFDGLAHHLFVDCGFAGNTVDYGDPENSFLDAVIERRLGLPITLTLLMMEVGRRVGVGVRGAGMPGHFLAGATDGERYCDPFHNGALLDAVGCAALYERVGGVAGSFSPAFLAPVSTQAILTRMLANLRATLLEREPASAAWAVRLRLLMPDCTPTERAALSAVLVRLGRFGEAAAELERAAQSVGGADGERLSREAATARARLN